MFPDSAPPRLGGLWRSTATGVAHAPQSPSEFRGARRRAVLLTVLVCLLMTGAVVMCGVALAHWGDAYVWLSNRTGEPGRYRPGTVLAIGLLLLVPAALAAMTARSLRRPRKPTVELTTTAVRSNMHGVVEVPWEDVTGARVTNGLHLDLAAPVASYRTGGRPRREDGTAELRLYAPHGDLLPFLTWLREHPESRAAVLAPWSDRVAVRDGEDERYG
ncbi:hypothetical protein ACF07T_40335 [Streptomyces sp. NPDC015184]|uniref:hypothetical protein n=1 Tax=Streptomyces sp. NPDC015184 TaxID=3364946 RepID=UPI0036F527B5